MLPASSRHLPLHHDRSPTWWAAGGGRRPSFGRSGVVPVDGAAGPGENLGDSLAGLGGAGADAAGGVLQGWPARFTTGWCVRVRSHWPGGFHTHSSCPRGAGDDVVWLPDRLFCFLSRHMPQLSTSRQPSSMPDRLTCRSAVFGRLMASAATKKRCGWPVAKPYRLQYSHRWGYAGCAVQISRAGGDPGHTGSGIMPQWLIGGTA